MLRHSKVPNWLVSSVNVPRLWWRAGVYGIRLRLAQPGLELFRLALLVLALLISAVTLALALIQETPPLPLLPVAVGAFVAILATSFAYLRYAGNLSRIMDVAAWSDEGASRIRQDMALGMQNNIAYEQLIEIYEPIRREANRALGSSRGFEAVTLPSGDRSSNRYAAIALAATSSDTLTSLLVDPICDRDRSRFHGLADSRQRLMRKWRETGSGKRELEDELRDNYCLAELRVDPASDGERLHLKVGVAAYGEIVRSCDSLINEFALFSYLTGSLRSRGRSMGRERRTLRMSPAAMLRCLPWRNRVHRKAGARPRDIRRHHWSFPHRAAPAGNLFLKPEDRAAGIGVAVVTLDVDDGRERFYLGMRSGIVGTYPSTNHVVPAGMCNTYGTDFEPRMEGKPPPEDYLSTTMKCEFIEEWFGVEEFEDNRQRDWAKRVNERWDEKMRSAAETWEEPSFTGIAFDLLNLRPEVCATAVVNTKDGVLNWEFDGNGFAGPLQAMGTIDPTEIVQSGAAALWLIGKSRATAESPAAAGG